MTAASRKYLHALRDLYRVERHPGISYWQRVEAERQYRAARAALGDVPLEEVRDLAEHALYLAGVGR